MASTRCDRRHRCRENLRRPDLPATHTPGGCNPDGVGFHSAAMHNLGMAKYRPWSELEIRDLRDALRRGYSIEDIATFLCRYADEVRAKVAEL